MGASRDFSSGSDSAQTGLLDREPQVRQRAHTRWSAASSTATLTPPLARPRRTAWEPAAPARSPKRLGSMQVVSERGRRLTPTKRHNPLAKISPAALALLVIGIVVAMQLSGQATSQTFVIQQLGRQEAQLNNELESLNRDRENLRSAADIARRAAEVGMGVPVDAGVLSVTDNGEVHEQRPAGDRIEAIIDINGEAIRPGRASSDPTATGSLPGRLNARPDSAAGMVAPDAEPGEPQRGPEAEESAAIPDLPAVAPYQFVDR